MSAGGRGAARLAGLGTGGLKSLYVLGLVSGAKAAALVVMAEAISRGIVSVIAADGEWVSPLLWGLAAALVRGGLAWFTHSWAARAAEGSKEGLRAQLAARLLSRGGSRVGSMSVLGTRGLDELDAYYRTVLPALTSTAVIPLVVGARILFADWFSAVVIVLTVALVPVFMALVGMHTGERVAVASAALARLSDHLVELARGLPVLVGLGRVEEQTAALRDISEDYRRRTMQSLRTAFMSSLVLELLSTISVAIVAVFVGFRLVNGSLTLDVALLVLILAPECFAPFRELGAAFHASQDGLGALERARAVVDESEPRPVLVGGNSASDGAVTVDGVEVTFAGRSEPAVDRITFRLAPLAITSLEGPSGSGKSTLLGVLAGQLADGTSGTTVTGSVSGVDPRRIAWMPQLPRTVGDTVLEELVIYSTGVAEPTGRIDELLLALRLDHLANADPAQLSPGELRRLAFARALLRVDAGAQLLLLDEPTAHLDGASARTVESMIAALRGRVTILVASHEATVAALATEHVRIGLATELREDSAQPDSPTPAVAGTAEPAAVGGSATRALLEFLRSAAGRYALAILLGTLASLFAISLAAVSGWLIVRASEHPSVMYLMVAIVGVRFFGVGRAALRYAERLVTHDAVFSSITELRVRLWRTLAAQGAASRKLLRGGTVLDYLVGSADEVRDLAPRVLIPGAVGVVSSAAALVAFSLLHAPAVPLLLACVLLSLVVAPAIALAADRAASTADQEIRSGVLRRFASAIGAAGDLAANGVAPVVRADLAERDAKAGRASRAASWALGLGSGLVVAACAATAVLMLAVSAPAVAAGTLPPAVVAVLVLVPLGLIDALTGVVDAVQQWPALARSLRRTSELAVARVPEPVGTGHELERVWSLELRGLAARWPGALSDAFDGVHARVETGDWLVVEGASGSGKSTLLTVLLGYLAPASGGFLVNDVDATEIGRDGLLRRIAWCPQDGHLFASTLRANLLIARAHDDRPDDESMIAVLRRVGLGDLFDSLEHGLDTRIGSGGSELSGGERQRVVVARTLLASADVVLLDEPTAHLDGGAAAVLMADLRSALRDCIVVLVTHHADDRRTSDHVVSLEPGAVDARVLETAGGPPALRG